MRTYGRLAGKLLTVWLALGLIGGAGAFAQTKTPPKSTTKAAAPAQTGLVDINTASKADLSALPGIGNVYSSKIIAGRPYKTKTDLKNRNIIPVATYNGIRDKIIANQPK